MLPQLETRHFGLVRVISPDSAYGRCSGPLVLKGSCSILCIFYSRLLAPQNWPLIGLLRYIKKFPVCCLTFRFNPVGSRIKSRRGGRPGRSASSKL